MVPEPDTDLSASRPAASPADPLGDLARLEGVASGVAAARAAVDAVLRDRGVRRVAPDRAAAALLAGARASAELTKNVEQWRPGAIRLATELVVLSRRIQSSPAQALARAHALAARGQVAQDTLGQVRPTPEGAARLDGLYEVLCGPITAPGIVVAAVAHAELATLAPFGSADGVVARAVEHMVLVSTGVDPLGVVVVEAGHAAQPDAYEDALSS